MNQRILCIEDEPIQQMLIAGILTSPIILTQVSSLAEAEAALVKNSFDLVLLDVNLPDGDGFLFYARLKTLPYAKDLPVIFITGNDSAPGEIMGFSLGAEDYITKPIEPARLRARLNSHLQRLGAKRADELTLERGDIRLNVSLQRACIVRDSGEVPVALTPVEFKLLFYFLRHEEHVLSRERLLNEIWGDASRVFDRTIDMHVSKLRRKINESTYAINAVQGVGYRLVREQ